MKVSAPDRHGCFAESFQVIPSEGVESEFILRNISDGKCAFNSLSRDHLLITWFAIPPRGPSLSTPSLGITNLDTWARRTVQAAAFNSLSRDHIFVFIGCPHDTGGNLSTPSLGITSRRMRSCSSGSYMLSTPSLGITRRARIRLALNKEYLSTPSLGITWDRRKEA